VTESAPLLAVLGAAVFAAVVWRPLFGACLFLLANPLIVGIARGQFGVPLRLNEALLIFILAALGVRALLLMLSGRYRATPFDRMDAALLGLVVTGSALPLFWRDARNLALSTDDLLYAAVLVKYYGLFRLFRSAVPDAAGVALCLRVSLFAAALVAVIGIFQIVRLFGAAEFLLAYYDAPFEGNGNDGMLADRATSTVASAFGLGDLMVINLIATLALMRMRAHGRVLLGAAAVLFLSGCIASGTFSVYIGLAVALIAYGAFTGSLHRLVPAGAAALPVAATAFWPVIEKRLEGFDRPSGMPRSWEGRWENLERFFLPEIVAGSNWLFGVRPAPRVPAPERWRTMVYIESGYVWLLWIGGVPFLLAFLWFTAVALRRLGRVARERADAVGCAALIGFCSVVSMAALMLFDPHLTIRGGADIFFPMLALALAPHGAAPTARTPGPAMPHRYAPIRGHEGFACER
jgi:hypothetical protein